LIGNRSTNVISISAIELSQLEDDGESVLRRLAPLLGVTPDVLKDRITVCGTEGAKRPPICWNGSPYQPIPVARDIDFDVAVRIMERRSEFPGVSAEVEAVRDISGVLGANMAHILGYLGPVNDEELNERKESDQNLQRTDLIGRSGLEAYYDSVLRGTPGVTTLSVDRSMAILGVQSETPAKAGSYLVLSVDAALQRVVEEELENAIFRARAQDFAGDSGAAVVMDVTNGQILAMASYPTYDPEIWLGGVSEKEYAELISDEANAPLVPRATQGVFAPASTFKVVTAAAAANAGLALGGKLYNCPSTIEIGDRTMRNYESNAFGPITVSRALEVSCNTVFYQMGYDMWVRDGGLDPVESPKDPIEKMARQYGLGSATGIDLPSESRGRVGGRQFKLDTYEQFRDLYCYRAEVGYPDVEKTDPERAAYLKLLAQENCQDGGVFRGGDAANLSIGQGDTVTTPLQMAVVYAALANGGKVLEPRVVKAIISANGKKVTPVKTAVKNRVSTSTETEMYIRKALKGVVENGTAASVFSGWPQGQIPIGAKTGSGQAGIGKDSTSWFATIAPIDNPKYVVVMMVSQGGTGSGTSGPSVRKIYEAIYGVTGQSINAKNSVLYQAKPAPTLPVVSANGTIRTVFGTEIADKRLLDLYGAGR
jgi:penicillin-binding protein 2